MIDTPQRALNIALRTRQFGLLADYPDAAVESRGERIERTMEPYRPAGLCDLDEQLIERAGELDRLCGYAVRTLRDKAQTSLLDLLASLGADRIVAMYYALPEPRRRAVVKRDAAWAFHVMRAPERMDTAFERVEQFADARPFAGPRSHARMTAFRREARRYAAGLPHELMPDQVEAVEQGTEAGAALLIAGEAMRRAGLDEASQRGVIHELLSQ